MTGFGGSREERWSEWFLAESVERDEVNDMPVPESENLKVPAFFVLECFAIVIFVKAAFQIFQDMLEMLSEKRYNDAAGISRRAC